MNYGKWTAAAAVFLLIGISTPFFEEDEVEGSMHSDEIRTQDQDTLTVTITPSDATEGDGIICGNVSIRSAMTDDLVVRLISSDYTEVILPTTVTITAGQTSADFNLTIVDDLEVDGDQRVTITASAEDHDSGTDNITVHDKASYVCKLSASDEDYVDFGSFQGFTYNTNWTVEEKVKIPSGATVGWHFFRGHAWADKSGDIAIQMRSDVNNGQVYAWVRSGGTWRSVQMDKGDQGLEILDDTWYTICLQYNLTTTTLNLYVNGLLVDQNTAISAMDDRSNTNPLLFGGQNVSRTAYGDLYSEADIIIANQAWFKRNLTTDEIAAYDGAVNLSDPDLFFATNITSSAIYDASGNGRNGTNGNSPEYYLEDTTGVNARVYNLDADTWYDTIQKAVDNATAGDSIWISGGTYSEHVVVDKTLNLTGNSSSSTFISSQGNDAITLNADWVNISSIAMSGANGIIITGHNNCTITDVNARSSSRGVYIYNGDHNHIIDSNLSSNSYTGIGIYWYSDNNVIRGCTLNNNSLYGVDIYSYARSNTVDRCEMSGNGNNGILINVGTDDTVVTNNTLGSNSNRGISISSCSSNIVRNNTITAATYGMDISYSGRNIIENNEVRNCGIGVQLSNSNNDTILGNVLKTVNYGIMQETVNDALIEGNILDSFYSYGINNHNSQRAMILNNSISLSSSEIGLVDSDTWYTVISGNTFGSSVNGYCIDALRTDGMSIRSNIFSGQGGHHIFLRGGSNSVVEGNAMINASTGVYIRNNPDSLIRSNLFRNNSQSAITFETQGDSALIYNNSFLNNGQGGSQVSPNTGNTWNLQYPGGGNYWSDYVGEDRFSGPDQNAPGSDGMGDSPFSLGAGAEDEYPLMAPSGTDEGDILITGLKTGDVVNGRILITAVCTAYDTARVDFLVNGNTSFTDYTEPYRFILDTNDFTEDSFIQVTARAVRRFGPDVEDTVRLFVSNLVDTGTFISVKTVNDTYHPDQMVTACINTLADIPEFDMVTLRINYNSPSGPIFFVSNNTYPGSDQWVVTFPIPSDAESGSYSLNITAFGYMKGTLLWWAQDTYVFSVSGRNTHEQLEEIDETTSDIESWAADIDYQNMTLQEILDRVKHIQNNVSHLNLSAGLLLDEIIIRMGRMESNLTSGLEGMNSSLQSIIAVGLSNVYSRLDDVDSMLSGIDTGIVGLDADIEDIDRKLSGRLDDLELEMYHNISALKEYIELRTDQMDLYLKAVNASLHYHLDEIRNEMDSMRADILNDLGGILSYLEGMNRTGVADRKNIMDSQEAISRLIRDLNNATISELRSGISDLKDCLAVLNSSEAERHASTLSSLLAEIDLVNGTISDHISQVVTSLEALEKMDDIMNDLEVMDKNLNTNQDDLTTNDNGIKLMVMVGLILIVITLLSVLYATFLKGPRNGGRKDNPPMEDGNNITTGEGAGTMKAQGVSGENKANREELKGSD